MHALIHKLGCGKPAFLWTEKPSNDDPVIAEKFRRLNGSEARPDDPIVCGSCGALLSMQDLRAEWFVEWTGEVDK